jgi:hypothetical protein
MARVLTRLRIDEVSAVIKGSNQPASVRIAKSDNPFLTIFAKLSDRTRGPNRHERRDAVERRAGNPNIPSAPSDHDLVQLADVVGNAHNVDQQSALYWLMHSPAGRALAQSMNKQENPMTKEQHLQEIVKKHGVVELAKFLVDDLDGHSISEPELVGLITAHAKRLHPGLSADQAFARVFGAQNEEGATLRKAVSVVKGFTATLAPLSTDGRADEGDAIDQLNALVEEQRKRSPFKSTAQLFAAVYTDPANRELVQKEREQAHQRNAQAMSRTLGLG